MNQEESAINAVSALVFRQQYNQAYDNLFSANHRNAMVEQYGMTEAQFITVEDLATFQ
jgi:hypothetical protein